MRYLLLLHLWHHQWQHQVFVVAIAASIICCCWLSGNMRYFFVAASWWQHGWQHGHLRQHEWQHEHQVFVVSHNVDLGNGFGGVSVVRAEFPQKKIVPLTTCSHVFQWTIEFSNSAEISTEQMF
ncbi:hypothetical protein DPMN_118398 [Dreissena polymorpha]|uniref:Uncharacterized protein n=1 Tax=Dreissena polymorpha TaxID=45954 RepID=A0A9D4JQ73_DREPO|nr:hypothetical protein DPMN_118398 [Dreissena polymorpha]